MKVKVAIVHPIFTPYRIPLFEKLAKESDLDVKIFLDVKSKNYRPFWESNEEYSFKYEFLEAVKVHLPWKIDRKDFGYICDNISYIPLRFLLVFKKLSPDIVISTELGIRTLFALMYIKFAGKKILVWSDEYLHGLKKHSQIRQKFRRLLVKMTNGFCSCGIENKKYLEFLGAKKEKIINVSIAVDNNYFQKNATKEAGERIRKELKLSGIVFLNVGQLIGRKGLDRLIKIWSTLPVELSTKVVLIVVGSGSDENRLKNIVNELHLSNVIFIPPKKLSELPAYYAACDVFIFPTLEDGWGLVVNEAMACGKPILCSKYAGCCTELLKENENGYSFDPLDEEDTKQAIIKMYKKQKQELEIMGKVSKKIISEFTYNRMVTGFKKAIYYCLEG